MKVIRYSVLITLFLFMTNTGVYSQVTSMKAAQKAYSQALQARSMQQIIRALMLTGDAYKKNYIDSAYKTYAFALKLSDRFGLVKFRPQLFFELAMLHCRGFNFEPAVKLFDSAYAIAMKHHLYLQAGVALGNIASFINDQDSNVTTLKKAVSLDAAV